MRKLKFKLVRNVIPLYGTSYTTCIGCDTVFKEMLNIKDDAISQTGRVNSVSQNNTRNTSSFTSTSSTSQSQSTRRQVPTSVMRSSENDSDVELIETPNLSGRHAQNHSNTFRSNNPSNNVNRSATTSDNRRSLDFWNNMVDFNNSENRSDRSRNAVNANDRTNAWGNIDSSAEIMCKCHETAIQLTVRKEGPNKGKWGWYLSHSRNINVLHTHTSLILLAILGRLFYKCAKPQGSGCDFFLWASDSETQNDTTNDRVNRVDRSNNSAGHSSRIAAPNNDWQVASTNDVMCTCDQPARK